MYWGLFRCANASRPTPWYTLQLGLSVVTYSRCFMTIQGDYSESYCILPSNTKLHYALLDLDFDRGAIAWNNLGSLTNLNTCACATGKPCLRVWLAGSCIAAISYHPPFSVHSARNSKVEDWIWQWSEKHVWLYLNKCWILATTYQHVLPL